MPRIQTEIFCWPSKLWINRHRLLTHQMYGNVNKRLLLHSICEVQTLTHALNQFEKDTKCEFVPTLF